MQRGEQSSFVAAMICDACLLCDLFVPLVRHQSVSTFLVPFKDVRVALSTLLPKQVIAMVGWIQDSSTARQESDGRAVSAYHASDGNAACKQQRLSLRVIHYFDRSSPCSPGLEA